MAKKPAITTKTDESEISNDNWSTRPAVMQVRPFRLHTSFEPRGSQPEAIAELNSACEQNEKFQCLLGITGSGKTFTIANVIEKQQKPTLVIAHNKTLAAQLYSEFKALFPDNAVEYFVSYYDYYQPEAYVAVSDTYIEKDSTINEQIDRMRHAATYALLSRNDVIIVASVSCIFGIGDADAYSNMVAPMTVGMQIDRDQLLRRLVSMRYERNDIDFHRGTFRVRGDVVEIFPAYEDDLALRIEFFGDEIEAIREVDPMRGVARGTLSAITIFPASHYVTPAHRLRKAIEGIKVELTTRLIELNDKLKLVEAQRLEQRTMFDIEMMEEMGHCSGIENYSRHLSGGEPGQPPPTLIDYFPAEFLMIVDESHQTIPQIGAMYKGDRSRKQTLVDHGFRLPSALDNRPLKFEEWEQRLGQVIFVSATPGEYEIEKVQGVVVEQIIRPTGLLDPKIEIRPISGQVDNLLDEIKRRCELNQRVLVTTLTKRMAEDLTEYYADIGVRVRYIHADVDTIERVELIRGLRRGEFDVMVGINLLREGLDIPEVSLVAILDADKEGFLRNRRSLIQTCGRAARNVDGQIIMYADRVTASMQETIDETERRRSIQQKYNVKHGIIPQSTNAAISPLESEDRQERSSTIMDKAIDAQPIGFDMFRDIDFGPQEIEHKVKDLREKMAALAKELKFEEAARLRDSIRVLEAKQLEFRKR